MILRVDKIEIQQQPERKRFWAEVEPIGLRGSPMGEGLRRKIITTPEDEGHWGMLRAIGEYLDEFLPKPAGVEWLSAEEAAEVRARAIPVLPKPMNALEDEHVRRLYAGTMQARPTHTPDGARLCITDDNTIGDVLKDDRGRAWLWELMGLRPYSETLAGVAAEELSIDDVREVYSDAKAWDAAGRPEEWPPHNKAALDALRADAEAAGVRVDGRWGEARLREEIASARQREAPQDA